MSLTWGPLYLKSTCFLQSFMEDNCGEIELHIPINHVFCFERRKDNPVSNAEIEGYFGRCNPYLTTKFK